MTLVPAIYIGVGPAWFVRQTQGTGADPEVGVSGVTVRRIDSAEAAVSGAWAWLTCDLGAGVVTTDPSGTAKFGITSGGVPYYDSAGAAGGEGAAVTASGDSIPALKTTIDGIFGVPGSLAAKITAAAAAASAEIVTVTLAR